VQCRPPNRSCARRSTRPPAGSVTDDDRRRRQTTDASEQNNTGPLGGPVIILTTFMNVFVHIRPNSLSMRVSTFECPCKLQNYCIRTMHTRSLQVESCRLIVLFLNCGANLEWLLSSCAVGLSATPLREPVIDRMPLLLHPGRSAKYCDSAAVCLFECLNCLLAHLKNHRPNFTQFFVSITFYRGSVLL